MTQIKLKRVALALTLAFTALGAQATDYYVSYSAGNDINTGLVGAPVKNIQKAVLKTAAGDTVYIMNGTYLYDPTVNLSKDGVVVIPASRSGTAAQPITYKAYPGHRPVIKVMKADDLWSAVQISASHINFEGVEVVGDVANMTQAEGHAAKLNYKHQKLAGTTPTDYTNIRKFNTHGINIKSDWTGAIPHHINIRNNKVHDMPGSAIASATGDYLTVENNVVYNNSWRTMYATSGLNFFFKNSDSNVDTTVYKNFIRNNTTYNNRTEVGWADKELEKNLNADNQIWYSDGNGLIVDSSPYSVFKGKTLLANNLSYDNGGSGINIIKADNIDVLYNTTSNNGLRGNGDGTNRYSEITVISSDWVKVLNNIAYRNAEATPNLALTGYNSTNMSTDYNVLVGGVSQVTLPATDHNSYQDPQFVNRGAKDFRLGINSPAKDNATTSFTVPTDNQLNTRPQNAGPDRGAFERVNPFTLSKTAWVATAFATYSASFPASKTVDSNAASYWQSGTGMAIGQSFQIDMQSIKSVGRVVFGTESTGQNFPAGVDIFVSNDPQELGFPVKRVWNNTSATIDTSFVTKAGRYLTLKINTDKANWWAINEITLHTSNQ
ncbi:MAG: discoidin domain-containing protein [Pseudomonadota bacterium]